MTEMPVPDQQDIEWAYYLWNSLSIGDGRWVLPNVGAYVRTGVKQLTLREIHFARPNLNEFGDSVFDSHHWIMTLADNVGWEVKEAVLMATDSEGEINIPAELIGTVSMCANRCGAVFRVEALSPAQQYVKVSESLACPCCGQEHSIEPELNGVHIVVDDRGYQINKEKQIKLEEEE